MVKKYFFSFLFICLINIVFSQSIDRSKKDLGSGSNKNNKSSSSRSINIQNYDPDFIITVLRIFGYASYGILIGDYENEEHLYNNLNSHPFSVKGRGNYSETDTISRTNFRIDLANKFVSSGSSLKGNHFDFKIRPSKYFYFSSDWYQLYEYNTFTKKKDALSLYYFNFAYDRIRSENFNLGWTMGASYVGNEIKKGGFSYGLNAEFFFDKKVSLLADVKWSTINENPVNSYQFAIKYFKQNYFATIGYERLKIGTPVYNLIGIGAGIYF